MLTVARGLVAAGLSVIPIAPGTKEPAARLLPKHLDESSGEHRPTWKDFQQRLPSDRELDYWFKSGEHGLAVVTGAVSGGLLVLDFDQAGAFERWQATVAQLDPDLLGPLAVVRTAHGMHVYWRMPEAPPNRKLACGEGRKTIAETRGEGGYVLAPPTRHPDGPVYTVVSGSLAEIPTLRADQALLLLSAARALQPEAPVRAAGDSPAGADDVIGAFNQAHTIEDVLEQHGYTCERPGRYKRPGGERSSVLISDGRSTHFNTNDSLYSEAPGGGMRRHTPFSAWCQLVHAGDLKAAVKAAAAELGLARAPTDRELLSQAGRALGLGAAASSAEGDDSAWPYFIHDGGLWMHRSDKEGAPRAPLVLGNFTARIVAETLIDDGDEQSESYTIEARCGTRTRRLEMRRADFEGEGALARIVAALGARARVNPLAQNRVVLDAIKAFSQHVTEATVYTHTGWVGQRYLFSNGYVDAGGWHPGQECQLPERLQRYQLLPGGELGAALTLFEELLELAPAAVMVPLLGGVLLAPVAHTLDAPAPMVHIYGQTGSRKTSLCCAALALWGLFLPANPTDSWTSTSNSTQRLGWHLKDAPMLLDDYKLANVRPKDVTFLLQNYGDNMARGRLDGNSELNRVYPIRATLLSSGEDQPEGEAAVLARILSVPVKRASVHLGHLSTIQQQPHGLHPLTAAYLQWLASRPACLEGNAGALRSIRATVLHKLEQGQEHAANPGRVASNVAALYVAWETFSAFLVARGLWSAERRDGWLATCKRELYTLARTQVELTTQERYSQVFLETLRGLIAGGRALLLDLEGGAQDQLASQLLVGGYDRHGTYLICSAAYDLVATHLRGTGRPVGFTARALSQMLDAEGLLLSTHENRLAIQKRINQVRAWCWHLPGGILREL